MSKNRLTITLSKDVLQLIDQTIDGKHIRNRSHAIESLLLKQLRGVIFQGVILAGGDPHALEKTLTPVSGQPLLIHSLNLLQSYGIKHVYILTDNPPDLIADSIKPYQNVHIIKQRHGLGTAGALFQLKNRLNDQPFIVMHSDIFTDINLEELIMFHMNQNSLATICVKPKLNQREFGKVLMQGNRITEFHSTPVRSEVGMVNTGVYIFNPGIFPRLKKRGKAMLETDVFPKLSEEKALTGFIFEGIWYEVRNPDQDN
jgi:NDP-sugar pyrophosphorylase family protein